MSEYTVTWKIQVDTENPESAAKEALEIQRDPDSIATCFWVQDENETCEWLIDLSYPSPVRHVSPMKYPQDAKNST